MYIVALTICYVYNRMICRIMNMKQMCCVYLFPSVSILKNIKLKYGYEHVQCWYAYAIQHHINLCFYQQKGHPHYDSCIISIERVIFIFKICCSHVSVCFNDRNGKLIFLLLKYILNSYTTYVYMRVCVCALQELMHLNILFDNISFEFNILRS